MAGQNPRPDVSQRMQSIDEKLKEAQMALNEIDDVEQDPTRAALADLMAELDKLNNNLRAMAQSLAPTNDEDK